MKARFSSFFRPKGSTAAQGNVPQHSGKQTDHSKAIPLSSTSTESTSGMAGHISPPVNSSVITQPRTINVVLFGETGVGKSSVINLIARRRIAKVSSDVDGCTMHSTRYDISFDDLNFAIFDTIGLEQPRMEVNGYAKAIEKAYELIIKLSAAGGIHLLVFCMRGGRIGPTAQNNYRLFCECLCSTGVPVALVFTGLEREEEMEDWWTRNKTYVENQGIKSDDHACTTAVHDDTPGEDLKYTESQMRIRELLKSCALKNKAFLPEPNTWFANTGGGLKSFIENGLAPKRKDIMKVLMNRCKLDRESAKKIADMMEKADTQTKDRTQVKQAGDTEGEDRSNPETGAGGKHQREVAKESATKDDVKAESRIDGGKDGELREKYRSGGDQPGWGVAEQAKQGAAKKPLVSSPRQVVGSHY